MAKKFLYRLDKILNLKKIKEHMSLLEVNKKIVALNAVNKKIKESQKTIYFAREESSNIGTQDGDKKVLLNQLRDESIKGQGELIKVFEKEKQIIEHEKSQAQALLKSASIEKKKYENHLEHKKQDHKNILKQHEMKFLDEIATLRRKSREIL